MISYAVAVAGGFLMLLSPCSALLLPSFFAYAFSRTGTLISRTGIFLLGLLTTLVPLGVAAATLGSLLTAHQELVVTVSAVVIIVLGVVLALGVTIPLPQARTRAGSGPLATYLLGAVYGLAGTCSGPILGSVLAVAALGQNQLRAGLMMVLFAVGMVLPLLLLAMLWERLRIPERGWLRPRPVQLGPVSTTVTNLIAGILFIGVGVLFWVTDGTANLGGVLGVGDQQSLEQGLLGPLLRVPDVVTVLLVFVVVAAAVAVHRWARSRR